MATCFSAVCQPPAQYYPSIALRLTRWTCADDCGYHCMHRITDEAERDGSRIHQYNGKWPFWRWAGIQEPASTLFSLMNLAVHFRGAREIQRRIPETHPLKGYYLNFAFVSMNAWIWSSVFHTRDLPRTEALDYFSAAAAILYALYYTAVRMFHLYPEHHRLIISRRDSRSIAYNIWRAFCGLLFLGHISYLSLLPRFDYTYNIIFNIVVGLAHNFLWVIYALPIRAIHRFPNRSPSYRPFYAYKAVVFVAVTTAATALELLDFPPWGRILDAHALWHLSTVPIAAFWYRFLIQDALDDSWKGYKP
ncbi:hypothetical protein EIP91_003790 [Steccherinum ochraceum]|uniref:Post-GPI attachment to proteins factor 3 n=1 Tax=Steccherinum ochraceum TaxID=92696 RepID=A0A4R0RCG1_9APHY|nr:hypothetical protein EIP91_003790 [Steccherinum ochraceum]